MLECVVERSLPQKDMAEVALAAWDHAKGSRFSAVSGEGRILLLCFFLLSWLL